MLLSSQMLWEGPGADVKEGLVTVARRAGMTRERVEQCLLDDAKLKEIQAAQERVGTELNFRTIPTFFVNGRMRGPGPFEDFDTLFKGILTQLGVQPPAGTQPAQPTPAPAGDAAAPSNPQNNPTQGESTGSESDTTPPSP
jgi:hypothetical protein